MNYIDPHIHMTARTTDDYQLMASQGIRAIIEPAFWLGQPRTSVGAFQDYFSSLVGWERFRAAQFGIRHFCTIGLNPREANNLYVADAVLELLPLYLSKEGVVAVGEIGYDDMTDSEDKYFRAQVELAKDFNLPVMIHTPHRNKKAGTLRSMDTCRDVGIPPHMVVIDHNNEETVKDVLDRGYWAAFTIYPKTKMGNERMVDIVRQYGQERIIVDSAADWGISDPLAVPKTARLMLERGIPQSQIDAVSYGNAILAYGQSGQFDEHLWLNPDPIDQRMFFQGNTVLRGGQQPLVQEPADSNIIE